MSFRNSIGVILLLVASLPGGAATPTVQKFEKEGVAVEFLPAATAVEGKDVELRFALHAADGTPLTGVRPAAWIDARDPADKAAEGRTCRDKIQSFLSGTLRARPQVDLNTFYVITLNTEPSIAVIDPLLGFGGSKLLTAITLESPGVDWVLSPDQKRLYVAMPLVNQVAVIDTESWRIVRNVETGYRPSRLALDKSGARLWVLQQNDSADAAAVTVIDTATLAPAAKLKTGRGPHQLAFGLNGGQAFVSNGRDGTVSIVETASLRNVGEIRTGTTVDGLAYTPLGNAVYAIDGADGTIALLDADARKVAKRIAAKPGINSIQFAPAGRWGFVTNGKENAVHVIDASTASLITTAHDVGAGPDQIAFTDEFAYVRAAGSDQVKMIRLAGLGTDAEPSVATFPAGQLPPSAARAESFAAAIVPSPEPKSVLVANPADRLVYYYSEGMAAPMGNLVAKGRTPKAVLVVDRSLKEGAPSVFSIRTQVPAAGKYDVAFFLDSPRVVHCFALDVQPDPSAPPKPVEQTLAIEPLLAEGPIVAGRNLEVKFRLSDAATHELQRGVGDLRALAFLAPGTWQMRIDAKPDADGLYRVTVPVQEPGIYYVFLESPSLKLKINRSRPLIFQAVAEEVTGR